MIITKKFKPTIGKEIQTNHPMSFIWVIDNFLTEDECNLIIESVDGNLERAVVRRGKHDGETSKHRTNSTAYLEPDYEELNDIETKIENMISEFTTLPIDHQEFPFAIQHYGVGEKFDTHWDHFDMWHNPELFEYIQEQGQRLFSILIYLNEPEEGGETYYNHTDTNIKIKPEVGKVVIHANVLNDSSNPKSRHEALPVIKGEKWALVTFVRNKKYNKNTMTWRWSDK